MADDGFETYSLSDRAMQYEKEKKSGATSLSYSDWCAQVWHVKRKEQLNQ